MVRFVFPIVAGLTLAACSTVSERVTDVVTADRFSPKTAEEIAADGWEKLQDTTSASLITRDRIVVEAWGGPVTGTETIEYRLLARAGSEVDKHGFTHFVIRDLRARGAGGDAISVRIRPIGTYEDLVANRATREGGSLLRGGLKAIIEPLSADAPAVQQGRAFEALVVYNNLVASELVD